MNLQSNSNKILSESIAKVLKLGIGAAIEIQGWLYIRDLEDGTFCVGGTYGPHMENFVMPKENEVWPTWEQEFTNIQKALEFFIDYRMQHKLGIDFEVVHEN